MQVIKCKALCLFSYEGAILVTKDADPETGSTFCRPLGGSIEFGERSREAVIREIKEELGADITDVKFLGVLESLFDYAGAPCHELVFIYDAKFADPQMYNQTQIIGQETDGSKIVATWQIIGQSIDSLGKNERLVPEGLLDLLTMWLDR